MCGARGCRSLVQGLGAGETGVGDGFGETWKLLTFCEGCSKVPKYRSLLMIVFPLDGELGWASNGSL